MKKVLLIMGMVLSISAMAGCGGSRKQSAEQPAHQAEQKQQEAMQKQTQTVVDTENFIGEERAKEIALEKAGITAEEVVFDKTELDEDDGVWHYDVEFKSNTTEYDADIKADDGTVISWETEQND